MNRAKTQRTFKPECGLADREFKYMELTPPRRATGLHFAGPSVSNLTQLQIRHLLRRFKSLQRFDHIA